MKKSVIINVCGNVASGKSTFALELGDWFNFPILLEEVSRISLFEKYCLDPVSWASQTQMQFLLDKLSRAIGSQASEVTVIDRSLSEDALIFAAMHRDLGNITDADYSAYLEIFRNASKFLPKNQIDVFVACGRSEQERRIKNRGVSERKMLSNHYLDDLQTRYSAFEGSRHFSVKYCSESGSIKTAIDQIERILTSFN